MKDKYHIYAKVQDKFFTWIVTQEEMPCTIKGIKGIGPDCGGSVLGNVSIDDAVKKMIDTVSQYVKKENVEYIVGDAPFETIPRIVYKDKHSLRETIDKYF